MVYHHQLLLPPNDQFFPPFCEDWDNPTRVGKSIHTTRNSVISLLVTLHVSGTYQLCHVNVVLLAEFSYPTIVWRRHGSSEYDH